KAPAQWGEKADTATGDLSSWWGVFNDPTLNGLVDRGLKANRDLKIAAARIDEARAQLGVVFGHLLPEIDAAADYTKSRVSPNGQPFPISQIYQSRYKVGFDAS